jgi:protein TonB
VTSPGGGVANGGGEGMGSDIGTTGPPAGGPGSFVAFDTPPQRLSEIEPEYPELAIAARSQGTVLVQVTIDETGKVIEAVVVQSDVISLLEHAALKAAKATPFRPAKQRDVPVSSRVVLPFRFRLKSEEGS